MVVDPEKIATIHNPGGVFGHSSGKGLPANLPAEYRLDP
jgi:hypothetical protein